MFYRPGAADYASQDLVKLLGLSSSRKPPVNEGSLFSFNNNDLYLTLTSPFIVKLNPRP